MKKVLFFFLASFGLWSQEPMEEEAPEALLETQLGDADVEFFIEGSWTVKTSVGMGFGWDEVGIREFLGLSEVARGLFLAQEPDLHFRVLIEKRWLSEFHYTSGQTGNTFLLGYRGAERENLQYVNLGTAPIAIPPRAGVTPATNRPGAPALNLGLQTETSNHALLLQYEGRQDEVKVFQGRRELLTKEIAPDGWIQRRFFRLPQKGLTGLRFLLGSQGVYRSADPGEVVADAATGLVEIPVIKEQTYLVRWDGFAAGVDPITVLARQTRTVASEVWLVLTDGPAWSSLELKNRYPLPDEWREGQFDLTVTLSKLGSDIGLASDMRVSIDEAGRFITLESTLSPGPDYPFYSRVPLLYNPGGQSTQGGQDYKVLVKLLRRSEGISLGTGVQAGSVRAYRNGLTFSAFTVDHASGQVTISDVVFPDDRWEFYFLKQTPDGGAGRLFFFQGNRWQVSENQSLETMAGVLWTMEAGAFTNESGEAPGTILGRAIYIGKEGNFNWELEAGIRAEIPDSTGLRRWQGWTGDPSTLALDGLSLRPGTLPEQDAVWGTDDPGDVLELTAGNRGRLRYRDYFTRDVFGNIFLREFGTPGVALAPYASLEAVGPFLATGGGGNTNTAAVLEYELEASRRWVSAQFFLNDGGVTDLTGARVLRFSHKLETASPQVRIFVLIGSLGEDPDSNGTVRTRVYQPVEGLPWKDQAEGLEMIFPTPAASPARTAFQGRSYYVSPVHQQVISKEITVPGSSWTPVEINLDADEARLLSQTNSLQVVVVSTNAVSLTGSYLVSSIEWEGSQASAILPSVTPPRVWERLETSLVSQSDLESSIFSESKDNRALYATSGIGEGPWEIRFPLKSLNLQDYRILSLYIRVPNGPASVPLKLKLLDSADVGVEWSFTVSPSATWKKLELNLETRQGSIDGVPVGSFSWDSQSGEIRVGSLIYDDTQAVEIWVDELTARESLVRLEPDLRGLIRFSSEGQILEAETRLDSNNQSLRGLYSGRLGLLTSKVETRFGWLPELRVQNQYEESLQLGGYLVREAYSDLGRREEAVNLPIPFLGTFSLKANLGWNAWSKVQKFTFTHKGFFQELFGPQLTLGLDANLEQGTGQGITGESSVDLWLESFIRLFEWEPGYLQKRFWDSTASTSWKTESFSIEGSIKGTWSELDVENWKRERVWDLKLKAETKLGDLQRPWIWSLGLNRKVSGTRSLGASSTLNGAFSLWGEELIQDYTYGLSFPFSEWNPDSASFWQDRVPAYGTLSVLGRLDSGLSRPPSFGRIDFFLPSSLSVFWEMTQQYSGGNLPPAPSASLLLRWQALNQFGSFSPEPLTQLYEEDEFGTILRLDYHDLLTDPERYVAFSLLQNAAFFTQDTEWKLDQTIMVQNQIETTWTWTGGITWRWDLPVDFPLEIPYMRTPAGFQEKWVFQFGANAGAGNSTASAGWSIKKVRIKPLAEWYFHPYGVLKVYIVSGMEFLEGVNVFGAEAGLELRLKF